MPIIGPTSIFATIDQLWKFQNVPRVTGIVQIAANTLIMIDCRKAHAFGKRLLAIRIPRVARKES